MQNANAKGSALNPSLQRPCFKLKSPVWTIITVRWLSGAEEFFGGFPPVRMLGRVFKTIGTRTKQKLTRRPIIVFRPQISDMRCSCCFQSANTTKAQSEKMTKHQQTFIVRRCIGGTQCFPLIASL